MATESFREIISLKKTMSVNLNFCNSNIVNKQLFVYLSCQKAHILSIIISSLPLFDPSRTTHFFPRVINILIFLNHNILLILIVAFK